MKFVDSIISKLISELQKKQDHETLVLWAADCAEHVLPYFEEVYPGDNRPREAVEAGRAWLRGERTTGEARGAAFAAHAAAREAKNAAACASARSAGQAASAAHAVGHAVHAATYAAKAATFTLENNNAAKTITATDRERSWQYQHLLELGNNLKLHI